MQTYTCSELHVNSSDLSSWPLFACGVSNISERKQQLMRALILKAHQICTFIFLFSASLYLASEFWNDTGFYQNKLEHFQVFNLHYKVNVPQQVCHKDCVDGSDSDVALAKNATYCSTK